LDGGFEKLAPGGIGKWGGALSAVLPTVAAGIFMILTSALSDPLRMPTKG